MKCPKCRFNNIRYPFTRCPICNTKVEWTKKDIASDILERIFLSAGVAFLTTVILKLLLK